MIKYFYVLLGIISVVASDEVCYEHIGCFNDEWPFVSLQRPIPYLPWSPSEINTKFHLFTRKNRWISDILLYTNDSSIHSSHFQIFKPTKFIVHGFQSHGKANWIKKMSSVLLDAEDVNVIVVDWEKGAKPGLDYGQAATNTRVVGAEISVLIKKLQNLFSILQLNIHIIGHSLGAHIAGYAGERLKNLGRITGLDPAEPFFQGTPPEVRLDPTDANYVDAIHTDGKPIWQLGWGMMDPVGHADFYPNGGQDQPGCPGNEEEGGNWWEISCNHGRANDLMIDSILNSHLPMYGTPCSDYETFVNGRCGTCLTEKNCAVMGYYSVLDDSLRNLSVKYYLETKSEAPYSV